MTKRKVLMLLEGVFPQDERVEKEILSLREAGHEVRIATYSFEKCSFTESYEGYVIYRRQLTRWMYKLGAAILVLPFYFAFWRHYVAMIYRDYEFDTLHIHDLPLARLGSEYKQKHGVFFVADQHEFYSNWIIKTAHYQSLAGKVISLFSNWVAYEKRHLNNADLVCTVEEPLRKLYIETRGLDEDKVIIVPNTPLKSVYGVPAGQDDDGAFRLFYHGGMDILRGLDVAMEAIALLKDELPDLSLVLVGKRNQHYDPEKRAKELGIEDRLEFRGWVNFRDLPGEIDRARICFFTPPSNREEIHNTIATKIYQYMARGKPMIVGRARYMKEFVETQGIGVAIDESSAASFAEALLGLHANPKLMKEYSENALLKAERFFWEYTVDALLGGYRDL